MRKISSLLFIFFLLLTGITAKISAQENPVDPFGTHTIPAIPPEDVGGFSRTKLVFGESLSTADKWTVAVSTVKAPFNNQWGSWIFHLITHETEPDIRLEFYDSTPTNNDNFKLANSTLIAGTGTLPLETPITIDITSDGTGNLMVYARQGELTGSRIVTGITEIYGVKNDYQREVTVTIAQLTAKITPITDQNLGDVLVNQSAVKTVTVNAIGLTQIAVAVSGDDAGAFSVPDVINAGDVLPITFSPTEKRAYNATITLSAEGVEDVVFSVTGDANFDLPVQISSDDNSDEHWYYIRFSRKAVDKLVWSLSNTETMIVQDTLNSAAAPRDDQQWKICGNWTEGYFLINKATGGEITYIAEDSDDGSITGNRYYQAPNTGDIFNFVRFKIGNEITSDWQFYNRSESANRYVNDSNGEYLCNYSANNEGNRLVFIPVDQPVIMTTATLLAFETPVSETSTKTISISALNLTTGIAAAISGADESAFSLDPASLSATGGELSITFSPNETKVYTATLFLNSGTTTLEISLTGNSDLDLPEFSASTTPSPADKWYYIQFGRQDGTQFAGGVSRVWTVEPTIEDVRLGTKVMSRPIVQGNTEQQWKIVGDWATGYKIISRNGGQMVLVDLDTNEEDDVVELRIVLAADFGDKFLFKNRNTTTGNYNFGRWQLQIVNKFDGNYNYLNDHGGGDNENAIGLYDPNDPGAYLNFIPVSNGNAIDTPSLDPNDTVIAVKYYTLLGQEVVRPATTGVYIVRSTYASGKIQAIKQLFVIK